MRARAVHLLKDHSTQAFGTRSVVRIASVLVSMLLTAAIAFSQAGNGTITGTITDPAGAVVSSVSVEVRNTETGVLSPAVSTATGLYSAVNLPPGPYSVTVAVPGFKKYSRTGLNLAVGQILAIDIPLEVGATTEAITVNAEASLLKTENGDVAHNITVEQLKDLPILGIGGANAGSSGVRNPFNSTVMIPGVSYVANTTMIINGAPTNTAAYRVEGLDNTNHTVAFALQENQPSADAIQEVAVQTSNYAPEFGQAGGGLFNITMKSGGNQYHGTGYEYFVNEDLNAGYPFSFTPEGAKYRPRNRRNDFGGTIGGPIRIPKLYNGTNKSFFFFSFEEFREASNLTFSDTLPTADYRNGDFSAISPNGGANFNQSLGVPSGSIGTDALGRPIFANAIYDPTTRTPGGNTADVFANNVIPISRISPFALGIQKLLPAPTNGNRTGNYAGSSLSQRISKIPSLKLDHSITDRDKLSFYWSTTGTDSQYSFPNGNADGLPELITIARGTFIHSATVRLNYDRVLTPTLLFHMGAGYSRISFIDDAPLTRNGGKFDCASISLAGCFVSFNFPTIGGTPAGSAPGTNVNPMLSPTLGGIQQLGNAQLHTHTLTLRPSFNTNMTWIHGNHTYKAGGEVWFQGNITAPPSGVFLSFNALATGATPANFGATAQPFSPPAGLSGQAMGFPYANFLLGDATSASQSAPTDSRMGKSQWALFVQDSWKITRKLTVDYGLRWDYGTANKEQYGRSANLGLIPNAAVGGRIGAPIFEATCNCDFVPSYPYAYAPRLGIAYQLDEKTVIRGGWGFAYGFQNDIIVNSAAISTTTPAGINAFADLSNANVLPRPIWPNFDPAQTPLPGQIVGFTGFTSLDRNAARPPRQDQWSIGIQREIARDFVMEASYVGNRGVWWTGPLGYLNQVSPQAFAAVGLSPYTNPADNLLLSQTLSSAAVVSRIGNYLPYPGYSTSNTLLNALRPYPQFSTITVTNSPTGKTWYDSLQLKGTKRMSHGLQVNGTFTWSKALVLTREDLFNPASSEKSIQTTDQPYLFNANILYQTQKWFKNRVVATVTKDWQLGAFVQYASGLPLTPPAATSASPNNLGASEMFRTGQPLFLKDLNCSCINPYTDQVLNPAAWANPAPGTFGPGPFTTALGLQSLLYTDFRQARHPTENFNIGRTFRIKERMALSIRAEFSNIFNRTQIGFPSTVNPLAAPGKNGAGNYTSGFGVINETLAANTVPSVGNGATSALYSQPRQGTIIARFVF
jgi:hypothetical protein